MFIADAKMFCMVLVPAEGCERIPKGSEDRAANGPAAGAAGAEAAAAGGGGLVLFAGADEDGAEG